MKIIIEGDAKEIAALVPKTQRRQDTDQSTRETFKEMLRSSFCDAASNPEISANDLIAMSRFLVSDRCIFPQSK